MLRDPCFSPTLHDLTSCLSKMLMKTRRAPARVASASADGHAAGAPSLTPGAVSCPALLHGGASEGADASACVKLLHVLPSVQPFFALWRAHCWQAQWTTTSSPRLLRTSARWPPP